MPVPVIDLGAEPASALAGPIDAALRSEGFFAIVGHGVPSAVQAAVFDASHRFFALPQASKERWHIDGWGDRAPRQPQAAAAPRGEQPRLGRPGALDRAPKQPQAAAAPRGELQSLGRPGALLKRGFDPIGWQALDPGQPPDVKESFYLGVEAIGPNPWPDQSLVPGFRAACEAYAAAMETLARRLMGLFEAALGLSAGHFDTFMRRPTCTTRLLHYPPQPSNAAPGQIGCGAHTDWGALTLLAQDDAGGLQVQSADGNWIDVAPLDGALVVNVGDMMQRWTNDRWHSTMHRVINRASGRDRWSIAYFFDLDAEASVEPLPSCVNAGNPARYAPITAGRHLEDMYRKTTVAA